MKKLSTLPFTLVVLLSAFGCVENTDELNEGIQATISATTEQHESKTRTSLNDGKVLWSKGDQIALLLEQDPTIPWKKVYTLKDEFAGKSRGEFTGEFMVPIRKWAIYPNSIYSYSAEKRIDIKIPETQTYVAGSFGNGANPMVGLSDELGENFDFKNVCGAVRLQIKDVNGATISSIKVTLPTTIPTGEVTAVSGDFTIAMPYIKEPIAAPMYMSNKHVTLTNINTKLTSAAQGFTIVLPVGTYPIGTTFTITNNGGKTMDVTTKSTFAIARSRVTPLATIWFASEGVLYFSDKAFRTWLVENKGMKLNAAGTDIDVNNAVNKQIFSTTTSINCSGKFIYSLKGIEHFTALTELDCSGNSLNYIDGLSKLTKLKTLVTNGCPITLLDVSTLTELKKLDCSHTTPSYSPHSDRLSQLDVSKNTQLEYLKCNYNQIMELTLAQTTCFTYFACDYNYIIKNINLVGNRTLIVEGGESALFVGRQQISPYNPLGFHLKVYVNPAQDAYQLTDTKNRNDLTTQIDNVTLKIGSYYYEDGTWSNDLNKSKKCLGIVFEVNGARNGKVVGLKESGACYWVIATAWFSVPKPKSESDGRANMEYFDKYIEDKKYNPAASCTWKDILPAAHWVTVQNGRDNGGWGYRDRWYFPAKNELASLYDGWNGGDGAANQEKRKWFNDQLAAADGTPISVNYYWSSTYSRFPEYSNYTTWALSFDNKEWSERLWRDKSPVRCIMQF